MFSRGIVVAALSILAMGVAPAAEAQVVNTPPNITFTMPTNDAGYLQVDQALITATDPDGVASLVCTANGAPIVVYTTFTHDGLTGVPNFTDDGETTLDCIATDRLGATNEANVDVLVDIGKPVLGALTVTPTIVPEGSPIKVSVTASDSFSGLDHAQLSITTFNFGLVRSMNLRGDRYVRTIPGILSPGHFQLTAYVYDKAGNWSQSGVDLGGLIVFDPSAAAKGAATFTPDDVQNQKLPGWQPWAPGQISFRMSFGYQNGALQPAGHLRVRYADGGFRMDAVSFRYLAPNFQRDWGFGGEASVRGDPTIYRMEGTIVDDTYNGGDFFGVALFAPGETSSSWDHATYLIFSQLPPDTLSLSPAS